MMKRHHSSDKGCFAEVPELERLSYFYGQMLGVQDFRSEQSYFREKLRLHNRCLHGYGVVCGLHLSPVPLKEPCIPDEYCDWRELCELLEKVEEDIKKLEEQAGKQDPAAPEDRELQKRLAELRTAREELKRKKECTPRPSHIDGLPALLRLESGMALDCDGNELIVREPAIVDLRKALNKKDVYKCVEERKPVHVFVYLCYCEQPSQRTRAVLPDSCGALSECNYGRYRESYRVKVSLEPPEEDHRCDVCCECCDDECLVLARIRWTPDKPIEEHDIDCSIRRPIGLYQPTVITGISWRHGATYTPRQARAVLGTEDGGPRTEGLEIRFSRPVYTKTLRPGVVDIWRIQGGAGLRGVISNVEGSFVNLHGEKTHHFHFRDESRESLNRGDRILIIVRCDFILDGCCRPVDGNHTAGRVPLLEEYAKHKWHHEHEHEHEQHEICRRPPTGCGPWTSGNGQPGGTFESWFYVDVKEGEYKS
jgi:hypothetical protein